MNLPKYRQTVLNAKAVDLVLFYLCALQKCLHRRKVGVFKFATNFITPFAVH